MNQVNQDQAGQAEDFRQLATAALSLSARMFKTMNAEQVESVERAAAAGGRILLEFGPIPEFDRAQLLLIEREGKRWPLATFNRAAGPVRV